MNASPPARVRPLRPSDLAEVGRIAHLTGFFGDPADRHFPDRALFTDLWARPYVLAGAPGFVAERGGRLLGYIVGTRSDREYRAALARLAPAVLLRALGGGYPRLAASLPFLARLALFPGPHAPADRFPAHLHLNLLEDARGLGLGGALLDAYLAALARDGVPGVQLSTTTRNAAALRLYASRGFETRGERETPLWTPWLGAPARHVVMARVTAPPGE